MTTPKQRNERLLQGCRVVRALQKDKKFDLNRWYTCGTVACFIGWSATDPWFIQRGFHLQKIGDCLTNTHRPAFRGYTDFEAVRVFFGVDREEQANLFTSRGPGTGTRSDVIWRIEKFVRENPA